MDAKLRIDLSQGVVELEGSEEFVREIYSDFKDRISAPAEVSRKKTNETQESKATPTPPSKRKSRTSKETHAIVKELDLAAKGDKTALKDFFPQHKVSANFERNLIFVYYLQNIAKVTPITSDHIYTCYRHVHIKVPVAFNQSLWDTSSKRGWIDTSSLDNIKLTTQGINYIEHDMAKVS